LCNIKALYINLIGTNFHLGESDFQNAEWKPILNAEDPDRCRMKKLWRRTEPEAHLPVSDTTEILDITGL
jgi:hypothetical protein